MRALVAIATVLTSAVAVGLWPSPASVTQAETAVAARRGVPELPAMASDACAAKALGASCSFDDAERSVHGICAQGSGPSLFCFAAPRASTRF